jgi:phosphopantetheinyl transferase
MGLILKKQDKNSLISVWEINESLDEIKRHFKNQELHNFKSKKRQLEFLCTRLLLKEINPELKIEYNKFGAPELNNHNYVSISHTNKLACTIISNDKTGIDVELISGKAFKIRNRFLSKKDNVELNNKEVTLAWSAKECIFKWFQKGDINFKKDIEIRSIKYAPKQEIDVKFRDSSYILKFMEIQNHFLVYFCR